MPASPRNLNPLIPFAPSAAVHALLASVEKVGAGGLGFSYVVDANLNRLRIPALRAPRQADELWKHTCFEAFIACGDEYVELNFSP